MTGGKLLGGYDEQWGNGGYAERWKAATWNLTGWAAGLLELPSLQSVVSPNDIVFCQQSNDPGSPIYTALPNGISSPTGTFLTNSPALVAKEGGAVLPLVVSIRAISASLGVAGVAPDGALELAGSTYGHGHHHRQRRRAGGLQRGRPAIHQSLHRGGAAPGRRAARPGVRDPPVPLSGPLGHAAATVSTDDMFIPRFEVDHKCGLGIAFNFALGGYNAQGVANWKCVTNPNCAEFASQPGWSQFGADVKVYELDLPIGPPAGFSF